MQYTEIFPTEKIENFTRKKFDVTMSPNLRPLRKYTIAIYRDFFSNENTENFTRKKNIFLIFLLKT